MILVTGATGTVGRELVLQLLGRGEKFRVLARDPAKVAFLAGRAEVAGGDLTRPGTLDAAVAGADKIFLLTVDQDTRSDRNLIQTAQKFGTPHVVKLSTSFVVNDPPTAIGLWHAEKEKLLMESGLPWTILRPGGFMSNSLQWAASVKAQGTVYLSSGTAQGAPIDPYDIAAVATSALTKRGHEGKAYRLTGPDLLDGAQQVAILSKALGKPLKHVDAPVSAAVEGMRKNPHLSPKMVDALEEMLTTIRAGKLAQTTTDTVKEIIGRKARTFEEWCKAHREAFL